MVNGGKRAGELTILVAARTNTLRGVSMNSDRLHSLIAQNSEKRAQKDETLLRLRREGGAIRLVVIPNPLIYYSAECVLWGTWARRNSTPAVFTVQSPPR